MGFVPGIVGLTKFVLKITHNMADVTLVTSPQLKDEMESFGIKRVRVWRKGIDTEVSHPGRRAKRPRGLGSRGLAKWVD